jgi:predicted PurR-regulated permease PerM
MPTTSSPHMQRITQLLFWTVVITLFVLFLQEIKAILLPFVIGAMVAYLFDPLADRLELNRFSRAGASAVVTITLFTILITAIILGGPLLYKQMLALIAVLPDLLREGQKIVEHHSAPLLDLLGQVNGTEISEEQLSPQKLLHLDTMMMGVAGSGMAAINVLSLLFLTPIVCFYLLRDWDRMVAAINKLLPRAYADTIREQCSEIDATLAGYLRGQVTVMFVLTIYYAIALTLIGIKFPIILALIAGLFIIIPYVGTLVSTALAVGIAYMEFSLEWQTIAVLAVYFVGQIMEQQILTPQIIGERVGLHPLWMLFGMLAGAVLLGFVGVLLAVPITAVAGVLVRFAVDRYLQSPFYKAK